jgi:hypothetical protein
MRKFLEFLFKPIYEAGFAAGFHKGWAEGYDSISKGLKKLDETIRLLERRRIIELLEGIKDYPRNWDYNDEIGSVIALIKGEK